MTDLPLHERDAWALVLALRARLRDQAPLAAPTGVRLDPEGALQEVSPAEAWIVLDPEAPRRWTWPSPQSPGDPALTQLFDLYLPLCVGPGIDRMVLAHLAQSLDGRIATSNGISQFISGHEDLLHTHRLRALFDAVVVGASTVEHDDPQLTTRLCPGDHPVRVVVDPRGRIGPEHRLVREGPAPTVLVRRAGLPSTPTPDHVDVVEVPHSDDPWIPIPALLDALRERGLRRIFIEGGGVTVSRVFDAGRLDRLQVCVCPLIIGSGRPSFTLPEALDLEAARQFDARPFTLGRDILFDCPLGGPPPSAS